MTAHKIPVVEGPLPDYATRVPSGFAAGRASGHDLMWGSKKKKQKFGVGSISPGRNRGDYVVEANLEVGGTAIIRLSPDLNPYSKTGYYVVSTTSPLSMAQESLIQKAVAKHAKTSAGRVSGDALAALERAAEALAVEKPNWPKPKEQVEALLVQLRMAGPMIPRTMGQAELGEILQRFGLVERDSRKRFVETRLAQAIPFSHFSKAVIQHARDAIEDVGYASGRTKQTKPMTSASWRAELFDLITKCSGIYMPSNDWCRIQIKDGVSPLEALSKLAAEAEQSGRDVDCSLVDGLGRKA